MEINQRKFILTGAASGIGKALLRQLNDFNVQILAVDKDRERLAATINSLPASSAKIASFVCDLADYTAIDDLFVKAKATMGEVDIFLANAGFAYYEKIMGPDWQHIEKIFQVNVFSSIYALEKMADFNRRREYYFVITASGMSKMAIPGYTLYSASKGALDRFAEGYRFEKSDLGRLALVYPIATKTKFFKHAGSQIPIPWPAQHPEVVAKAIIRGIRRNKKQIYPSKIFKLIYQLGKILPLITRTYQQIEAVKFKNWLTQSSLKEESSAK